jgi:hypothetical protein
MKVFLECHHGRGAVCSFWLTRKDPQRLGGAVDVSWLLGVDVSWGGLL